MSIYITGDTHIPIDINKISNKKWKEQKNLNKNDYLIICGDFGGVWDNSPSDQYWLKWLNEKPFTTLFVCGNHENFDLLNKYPAESWNGGKIHKIRDNIFHLKRGQVFNIDGTKVFTMGGASSHDKEHREEGINWWKEELPSQYEYDEALNNLDKHNWSVDLVLTHCAADSTQCQLARWYEHDKLTNFLETVKQDLQYEKWCFGHYHMDKEIDDKHICLYDNIIKFK